MRKKKGLGIDMTFQCYDMFHDKKLRVYLAVICILYIQCLKITTDWPIVDSNYSSLTLGFLLARIGLFTLSACCDSKGSGILDTMSFKKSNWSTVSIVFFLNIQMN